MFYYTILILSESQSFVTFHLKRKEYCLIVVEIVF